MRKILRAVLRKTPLLFPNKKKIKIIQLNRDPFVGQVLVQGQEYNTSKVLLI